MIVDVHTMAWESPAQLGAAVSARLLARRARAWDRPDASVEAFDRAMADVDYAVVLGFESALSGASITAQQVALRVQRRPGRCVGMAGIDPTVGRVDAAVRDAKALGMVGVVISPVGQGFHPCDSRAMGLYERCEREKLVVMVLPGTPPVGGVRAGRPEQTPPRGRGGLSGSVPGLSGVPGLPGALEFGRVELLDEVLRAFPGLTMVIAGVGAPWYDQTLALLDKHERVYADLSGLADQPRRLELTLGLAHESGVLEKLLLGSGFPMSTPADLVRAVYAVRSVPRTALESLVERDALACLGIAKPAAADEPAAREDEADIVMRVVTSAKSGKEG